MYALYLSLIIELNQMTFVSLHLANIGLIFLTDFIGQNRSLTSRSFLESISIIIKTLINT
jgi:hypothetical protein